MTHVVHAVFEKGVLRPLQELQLPEHTQVRITVESVDTTDSNNSPVPVVDPLEGLLVATGIPDLAERFDEYRFNRKSP